MLRCAVGDVTAAAVAGGGCSLLGRQGQIGGTRLEGSGPARFVQFAAAVGTSATSATRWCCCCGGFRVMMILIVFVCLWWILLRLLRRLFCVSFIATSDR